MAYNKKRVKQILRDLYGTENVDWEIFAWTMKFIKRYRKCLEELAKK